MRERVGRTGQKVLGATAVQLVNASPCPSTFKITNLTTVDVYIGFDKTVTSATGDLLHGTRGAFIILETNAPIWAVGLGASVSIMEIPA